MDRGSNSHGFSLDVFCGAGDVFGGLRSPSPIEENGKMKNRTAMINVLAELWEQDRFRLMELFPNGPPSRFVDVQEQIPAEQLHAVYNAVCSEMVLQVVGDYGVEVARG